MLHYYIIKLLVIYKSWLLPFYAHNSQLDTLYHHTIKNYLEGRKFSLCIQLDIQIDSQNHGKLFASICFLSKLKYFKISLFLCNCMWKPASLKSGHYVATVPVCQLLQQIVQLYYSLESQEYSQQNLYNTYSYTINYYNA